MSKLWACQISQNKKKHPVVQCKLDLKSSDQKQKNVKSVLCDRLFCHNYRVAQKNTKIRDGRLLQYHF